MTETTSNYNPEHHESCTDTEEESNSNVISFDIGLFRGGDPSSYRTQNDPLEPLQRSNVIERRSAAIDIRCSCVDVIHGLISSGSEEFATLILLEFGFDTRKRARRIQSVDVKLEFKGMKPGDRGPEVYKIAPLKTIKLVPTVHHKDIKQNASIQLGGAAPVGGVTATGTLGWEKTTSSDIKDHTTITGSIDLRNRTYGKYNSASWTLLENQTAKTGVPSWMRTAVLLKRKDEMPFQCVVEIDAEVDIKSTIERVFGGKGREPKDDPVLFDPLLEPTNKLAIYDVEELGAFDLEDAFDVTVGTVLEGVIKTRVLGLNERNNS